MKMKKKISQVWFFEQNAMSQKINFNSFSGGDGAYNIPNYGPISYCGLQGWMSILHNIVKNNDLSHPLCNQLRNEFWPVQYTISRLDK